MIKKRLKFQYVLLFIGALLVLPLLTVATIVKTNTNDAIIEETDFIPEEETHNYLPVINTTTKIINPYVDATVTEEKTYYDYKGEEESQIHSILKHENTYIQNSGIDYVGEKEFEVIAILDGTVTDIKEDETNGKTIELKHENGLISIYQSLSDIKVKKGDIVTQGQVIGISGENELEKDLGNHLHFELYDNGGSVNPKNYLNKEVEKTKEN